MLAARGRPVIPIAGIGSVGPVGTPGVVIAWADSLTVPIAREFLASSARILVTKTGSPVCHGANLLRVANLRHRVVGWVSGLVVEGSGEAAVSLDGAMTILTGNVNVRTGSDNTERAIFEFTNGARAAVCLWPDRQYTATEFLLQGRGLSLSAGDLCGQFVGVTRDVTGRLWFESETLDDALLRGFALDPSRALPKLREMATTYDHITSRVRQTPLEAVSGDLLERLGTAFFRQLLLFHTSYGEVIEDAAQALAPELDPGVAVRIAATNSLVRWLYASPRFQDSAKHGTQSEWWGHLPDISVRQATTETINSIRDAADDQGVLDGAALEELALMSVVKEMKMILSKNLFAAVAALETRAGRVGLIDWTSTPPTPAASLERTADGAAKEPTGT